MQNKIIVVIGPSASGKSSVCKVVETLCPDSFITNRGYTSRAPRDNDWEYKFFTKEQMEAKHKSGELICRTDVGGHIYGTSTAWIDMQHQAGRTPICILDWNGYKDIIAKYGANRIHGIFLDVEEEEQIKRLKERSNNEITENELDYRLSHSRDSRAGYYSNEIRKLSRHPVRYVRTGGYFRVALLNSVEHFLRHLRAIDSYSEVINLIGERYEED